MLFNSQRLRESCLLAISCQVTVTQAFTTQKRATTCVDESFTLCPPNAPAAGTSGGGSSSGPYVPPYALGPSPFQFINSLGRRAEQEQFCCNPTLECRSLTDYGTYICLNSTTSDFFMNDGSNGNAELGMYYNAPLDVNINIFTGDYVYANGTRGNGYDDTGSPRPTREVTGSLPEPTGDVVHAQSSSEPSTTVAASSARATSTTPASPSSSTSTTKPNAGSSLSRSTSGFWLAVLAVPFGQLAVNYLGA